MNRFVSGLLIAASVAAVSALCMGSSLAASNERAVPIGAPGTGSVGDAAQVHLLDAEVASQQGDWFASADLAEKSYRAKPDLWNEFNLATAYQHTRRGALAVPLYLDLVERGQYARTSPLYSYDRTWPAPMLPFIADEAAHRLRQMGVQATPQVAVTPAPLLAVR